MSHEGRFVFTVRQLTRYVRTLLARDRTLQDLWVRGEIADLTRHSSGHVYLTLKDEFSQLRCVLFREEAETLTFKPQSGSEVIARGTLGVYEPRGQYQLVVREMEQAGVGDLYLAFERLRRKLEEEGLFDDDRKRPLPAFPRRIALLTSAVGAAVHDLLSTIHGRWPPADVVLIPTPVSGAQAAAGIVRSLERLSVIEGLEVAILARGGGSMEELSGFNAEKVARAIAAAPVPVVTGIGHETDLTIADFVADHRAPTPTAAAVAATPDRRELLRFVERSRRRTAQRLRRAVVRYRRELALLRARPVLSRPRLLLAERRQRIDEIIGVIGRGAARRGSELHERLLRASEKLKALSPKAVLERGYSITRLLDGSVVRTVRQLTVGGAVEVVLSEGSAEVRIRELRPPDRAG
ncbi:MAG: exodeoxyribonuclease VII large subunit [Armatimonadota bacterium]|nr:MAG: exodeoxyribonuclease VII large subunit [Armatimonadota bacterium]